MQRRGDQPCSRSTSNVLAMAAGLLVLHERDERQRHLRELAIDDAMGKVRSWSAIIFIVYLQRGLTRSRCLRSKGSDSLKNALQHSAFQETDPSSTGSSGSGPYRASERNAFAAPSAR